MMKEFNNALASRFEQLESRISKLENLCSSTNIGTKISSETDNNLHTTSDSVMEELEERYRKKFNVLLYNFKESESDQSEDRKKYDAEAVTKIFKERKLVVSPLNIIRLGRINADKKPRPLKISFKSISDASAVLRSNTGNSRNLFRPDRTKQQRDHFNELKAQLNERKHLEPNLRISFRKGVPYLDTSPNVNNRTPSVNNPNDASSNNLN